MNGFAEQPPDNINREKRKEFRSLPESRTNKAYDYEPAEIRKIVRALKEAISAVENRREPLR